LNVIALCNWQVKHLTPLIGGVGVT